MCANQGFSFGITNRMTALTTSPLMILKGNTPANTNSLMGPISKFNRFMYSGVMMNQLATDRTTVNTNVPVNSAMMTAVFVFALFNR